MGNSFKFFMVATAPPHGRPESPPSHEHKPPSPPPPLTPPPGLLSSPRFSFRHYYSSSRSQRSRWINSNPYSLLELIAQRDWQQVLIRATLRPTEISQWHVWRWNQQVFDILPLHLACALQPPPQVVVMLLRFHADTARAYMSSSSSRHVSQRRSRRSLPLWGRRRRLNMAAAMTTTATTNMPLRREAEATDYSILTASSQLNSSKDDEDDCCSVENSIQSHTSEKEDFPQHSCSMPTIHAIPEEDDEEDTSSQSSSQTSQTSDDDFQDATSKMSGELLQDASVHSNSSRTQVVLQLTADGGLESLTLKGSKSTEETSSTEGATTLQDPNSPPSRPAVCLGSEKVQLLPLHVACLYQASPQVLRLLIEAFPEGVRTLCLGGMLPIHLLCSGGGNSPAFEGDTQLCDLFMDQASPLEDLDLPQALAVLVQAYPDSRSIPSRRHGLTPVEYAKQHGWWQADVWQWLLNPENDDFAEDLRHHQQRMQQLSTNKPLAMERNFVDFLETASYDSPFVDDSSDTASSAGVPLDIQYNRSAQARRTPQQLQEAVRQALAPEGKQDDVADAHQPRHVSLFGMLLSQDWEDALALVEEDPTQASVWHYGIDEHNVPWKRLPLHLVCAWNAPVGLVQVTLQAFPAGATSVDPYDGSLALHVACQSMDPDLQVVRLLLRAHFLGTKATDMNGRCPLHYAAISAARGTDATDPTSPYAVLQALVQEDPESVLCRDRLGKTPSELVVAMIEPSPESTTVVKFLEAIQMGVLEASDDFVCFQTSAAVEPGSHREV